MISLNEQAPEGIVRRTDGALDIVNIFPTIQGEGPFAGMPAIFIRLAGCNLRCPDCDTDYTTGRRYIPVVEISNECSKLSSKDSNANLSTRLVVITGGEPFRQNIVPLVQELLALGYRVQIETNGTAYNDNFPRADRLSVVCSPKTDRVHELLKPYVHVLKYIVEAGKTDPKDGLPLTTLGRNTPVAKPWHGFSGDVFIQPADQQNEECNKANLETAIGIVAKFGYRLSLQLHKLLGVE